MTIADGDSCLCIQIIGWATEAKSAYLLYGLYEFPFPGTKGYHFAISFEKWNNPWARRNYHANPTPRARRSSRRRS